MSVIKLTLKKKNMKAIVSSLVLNKIYVVPAMLVFLSGCGQTIRQHVSSAYMGQDMQIASAQITSGSSSQFFLLGLGGSKVSGVQAAIEDALEFVPGDTLVNMVAEERYVCFPACALPLFSVLHTHVSGVPVKLKGSRKERKEDLQNLSGQEIYNLFLEIRDKRRMTKLFYTLTPPRRQEIAKIATAKLESGQFSLATPMGNSAQSGSATPEEILIKLLISEKYLDTKWEARISGTTKSNPPQK